MSVRFSRQPRLMGATFTIAPLSTHHSPWYQGGKHVSTYHLSDGATLNGWAPLPASTALSSVGRQKTRSAEGGTDPFSELFVPDTVHQRDRDRARGNS